MNELEIELTEIFSNIWKKLNDIYVIRSDDNYEKFISNLKLLKDRLGYEILLDEFCFVVDDEIMLNIILLNPLLKSVIYFTHSLKSQSQYRMISLKDIFVLSHVREDEIHEYYAVKILRKKHEKLFLNSEIKAFPGLNSILDKYFKSHDLALREDVSTISRLKSLDGRELDLKTVFKTSNCPSGFLVTSLQNQKIISDCQFYFDKKTKNVELKLSNNFDFEHIKKTLSSLDNNYVFENLSTFTLLLLKLNSQSPNINTSDLSEKYKKTMMCCLELERINHSLNILNNLMTIINEKDIFQEVRKIIKELYQSVKINNVKNYSLLEFSKSIHQALICFSEINFKHFTSILKAFDGVGIISPDNAIEFGISGVNLGASGFSFDIRRSNPYLLYDKMNFEPNVHNFGDSQCRYNSLIEQINISFKILIELIESMQFDLNLNFCMETLFDINNLKANKYVAFQMIEGSNGISGHCLMSQNGNTRYRIFNQDLALSKLYQKIIVSNRKENAEIIWNSLGIRLNMLVR